MHPIFQIQNKRKNIMQKILNSKTLTKYKRNILNLLIAATISAMSSFIALIMIISSLLTQSHAAHYHVPLLAATLLIVSIITLIMVIANMIRIAKTFITTSNQVYDYFNNITSSVFNESRKDVTDE